RGQHEARDRGAEAETEVLRRSPERERADALLGCYEGDEQRLVRGAGHTDPGSADDRPSKGLPRSSDERKAGVTDRARQDGGDEDRLGAKPVEQSSGGKRHNGARAQDRAEYQAGGGR